MTWWRLLVLSLALASTATAGPLPSEVAVRAEVAEGPKLRVAAVVNFGDTGTEHFAGVLGRANGEIVALGNSWGPPFPAQATVLGPDRAREVPLFNGGTPTDEFPLEALPAVDHPNRSGFLVVYSPDLKSVNGVTRFGWGVATVDAAVLLPDGGLVTAGLARDGFAAVAGNAQRWPGRGRQGTDVYVARWRDDLKGLAWVWVLEQHSSVPARLYAGPDGRVVFDCGGVKAISADGAKLTEIPLPASQEDEDRFLRGVNPKSGALLLAGWTRSRRREPDWFGPLVEERAADGQRPVRFYDWRVALAWQPTIDLTAAAGVTQAEYLADGRIVLGAPMQRGRSVLERHPWDLTAAAKGRGVAAEELASFANRSTHGATTHCRLAQFDPQQPDDCLFAAWTGVSADGRDRGRGGAAVRTDHERHAARRGHGDGRWVPLHGRRRQRHRRSLRRFPERRADDRRHDSGRTTAPHRREPRLGLARRAGLRRPPSVPGRFRPGRLYRATRGAGRQTQRI
jgi:hypothetical protein